MTLAALSVDLDEIGCYFAIHGLGPPPEALARLVFDRALERIADLASDLALELTLFVVGADLERAENRAMILDLHRAGHEIASHSENHRYDLSRLSRARQQTEVEDAAARIACLTGQRPRGFRAPGYAVSDQLLEIVAESGATYDSSVFPCPPYYLAKAAVMAGLSAIGRPSRAILDSPRVLLCPRRPYRMGEHYWRRGAGLLELPIQTTRIGRVHFIGTTLALAGPTGAAWLTRQVTGEPLVNLELHGLDFLDQHDGLEALAKHQPDLRVPVARKLETFTRVVRALRDAGHHFMRLDRAAERLSAS